MIYEFVIDDGKHGKDDCVYDSSTKTLTMTNVIRSKTRSGSLDVTLLDVAGYALTMLLNSVSDTFTTPSHRLASMILTNVYGIHNTYRNGKLYIDMSPENLLKFRLAFPSPTV
jgi:hypothetical protein